MLAREIVAALDRQHPRDFFDVRDLLAQEGIGDALRRAFIVYLLSHNRPMSEVLAPMRIEKRTEFERGFQGMTAEPVALEELLATRESLVDLVVANMPDEHKKFLIFFELGKPDWSLLGMREPLKLPAVLWRQANLDKLSEDMRDCFRRPTPRG